MTAGAVLKALQAANENLSRLAYRTAYYSRIQPKYLPKSEDAIFSKQQQDKANRPPRQSMRQQFAMAKIITQALH